MKETSLLQRWATGGATEGWGRLGAREGWEEVQRRLEEKMWVEKAKGDVGHEMAGRKYNKYSIAGLGVTFALAQLRW